ncbi:ArsC/Spx/MgsR family protein [Maricaulis maris]|uniref:Arsenate reductase n=1 Tax=Maricaulis maris TaxID=74318 RepID=A0A495DDS0_9PROT|nr:ArsC/Spx/MgsR family protein [Maricaulis maris]RKR00489.1 arsenate reductase [Maricaulis maris]
MTGLAVYGLKNCDSCKKAVQALDEAGLGHQFNDIREDVDLVVKVPDWLDAVGAKALMNTRSTTWRNMSEEDREIAVEDPAGVLIAHPTLIKRPVIEAGTLVTVGWSADSLNGLLAGAAE